MKNFLDRHLGGKSGQRISEVNQVVIVHLEKTNSFKKIELQTIQKYTIIKLELVYTNEKNVE